MRKSKLSDAPWDIQLTNNTSSSLKISWKPPLNRDNAVAHYSVCYRTNTSQTCRTKIVAAHANSTVLENLDASTHYFIRVRAVTCKGPGNYSEEISNKTRGRRILCFFAIYRTLEKVASKWSQNYSPRLTHTKISHLVASLPTSRQQVVFALLVPSCQQVWNKLLTTRDNPVDIIRLVARLFQQVRHSHDITILLQPCVVSLVTFLLYHDCVRLVRTTL